MWKRLNNPKGARQPIYPDPKFDERFAGSRSMGMPLSPEYKTDAPSRPPRQDEESRVLPRLDFESVAPPPSEHGTSKFRPPSSIYSQPSPNPIVTRFGANTYKSPSHTEEVSPPSSPELSSARQRSQNQADEEVSPIEEKMPDVSRLGLSQENRPDSRQDKPGGSNIPVLRREKRRNQVAAAAANLVTRKDVGIKGRPAKDPSWDPYTGEPTTADRGKKQSTTPAQFTPPGVNTRSASGQRFGNVSSISAAPKTQLTFGERVRNLKSPTLTVERPEWKGASGRSKLVTPVEDKLDVAPLNIPRKSEKGVASPSFRSPISPQSSSEIGPVSPPLSDRVDPPTQTVFSDSGRSTPQSRNSPASENFANPLSSNPVSAPRTQVRANLPVEPREPPPEAISPEEQRFRDQYKHIAFDRNIPAEPYVQPPSRFSVSTYATSGAHSTPRPSTDEFDRPPMPTPPMPSPPQQFVAQPPSPIMSRKKAQGPRSGVTRKAIPDSSPVFISMRKADASKRVSNIAKSLPMSPAEAESHDLITSLQAQLDNLSHRRNNITKSIRQMTELMPTDSVMVNDEVRRKREGEKRKVEGLREEEADVRREEHDIGLRLHRAWKRKDKEAFYEPTGLWVRRVTG
ncbi:hypothetical protein LSUB1_G008153 [Lachnellula subtilissima]|uniref:Uncharacterized protein n=1 Tax=Lachnellula subtilissima TaxID=602034 RepID=A0A8H8U5W8_9HELO|nr:hypothetical protein LSUB1_G008153 [Lachnellula subtilissima]